MMSNKTYDILRWVQVILPLLGSLYYSLADIWALPYGTEIVSTCAALTGFLGAILKYSSAKYWEAADPKEEGLE